MPLPRSGSAPFQTKAFEFKLASIAEDGTFEGYAAVFGNVDAGGDVVEPGAFKATIEKKGHKFPLTTDHDLKLKGRVGVAEVFEDAKGLRVKGHFNLDKEAGRDAYADARHAEEHGIPLGMSFGYNVVDREYKGGVRHLKALDLWEVTLTQFPMNELAGVEAVKAADVMARAELDAKAVQGYRYDATSFGAAMEEREVWDRRWLLQGAFYEVVDNILWSTSLSDADQQDLLLAALDDFAAAYRAWIVDLVRTMGADGMKAAPEGYDAKARSIRDAIKAALAPEADNPVLDALLELKALFAERPQVPAA